ncbi:unnamed protein product [Blumeria hordei]|uniref:Uncharacterized protein n=1 Tax=Blumeria hordei TaxID=2867405 RepID=A0A383V3L0_BLUHO|nr:unnamed protein product [Blumeria hordei]
MIEATLKFSIPSQHDGSLLECRIYHPLNEGRSSAGRCCAAIVAHPYAPLGGSMDDAVVQLIASACLADGLIVGVFNFRGAGRSQGRTSWQGKAEMEDYQSFIAFVLYYLHHLRRLSTEDRLLSTSQYLSSRGSLNDLSETNSLSPQLEPSSFQSLLLLAGYSYGALITMALPSSLELILAPFESPEPDSVFSEIRRCAETLALRSRKNGHQSSSTQNRPPSAATRGPDLLETRETPIAISRIDHNIRVAYILISPLHGIVRDFLTLWTLRNWSFSSPTSPTDLKLQTNPTLAIYGDSDIFVGIKQLRRWAVPLAEVEIAQGGNQFRHVEVAGASHFWHDEHHSHILGEEVSTFITSLV